MCIAYLTHHRNLLELQNVCLVGLVTLLRDQQLPLLKAALADEPQPVPKSTHWWTHVVPKYNDKQFKRNFRVSRKVFDTVVSAIQNEPEFVTTPNNAGRFTCVSKQVGIAIWRLGRSASVNDVSVMFGVAPSTVIEATVRVQAAILRKLSHRITDLWPKDEEACAQLAAEFKKLAGMANCVGALDGTLVPIWRPGHAIDDYWCRKQFHALNFQVVSDAWRRVLYVGGGFPGTVWDGNAARSLTRRFFCHLRTCCRLFSYRSKLTIQNCFPIRLGGCTNVERSAWRAFGG
jgi:hypothetical protein